MSKKKNKKLYLSTHLSVSVGKPNFKFKGRFALDNKINGIDEINVLGMELSGTSEEIMIQLKKNAAAILSKAELETKGMPPYTTQQLQDRYLELSK